MTNTFWLSVGRLALRYWRWRAGRAEVSATMMAGVSNKRREQLSDTIVEAVLMAAFILLACSVVAVQR